MPRSKRSPVNGQQKAKGSGKFSALIDEILDEPTLIKHGTRQIAVTRRQALGIEMVNRAVAGDVRVVQLLARYGLFEQADEPMTIWISEALARL